MAARRAVDDGLIRASGTMAERLNMLNDFDGPNGAEVEMPRYKSHKEVWALKIKSIEPDGSAPRGASGSCIVTPEEPGYAPFRVDEEYCRKHNPKAGGYYVVYADGYKSWSPAAAFEEGYQRV